MIRIDAPPVVAGMHNDLWNLSGCVCMDESMNSSLLGQVVVQVARLVGKAVSTPPGRVIELDELTLPLKALAIRASPTDDSR